jgi:L-seryl-tRNA(Ser) seleniumtransferase
MIDPDRRRLPPVHEVLAWPGLEPLLASRGRGATLLAVRSAIEQAREAIVQGLEPDVDVASLGQAARTALLKARPWLRPLINATGILLNTGLGRAPLAVEAVEAVDRVVRGYCNLEFDLDRGERGSRLDGVEALLTRLTGAEGALVVNNNAAATILAVRALAKGREVVVSRGQLVEIGGSFRLPEIIEVSGAQLVEVGTTNKTRLDDYARAIGPNTAALLRVHPSNYRVVGFTEEVAIADLARLGEERDLWTIDDIGSGALAPGLPPHVRGEPTATEGIAAGADLVLFSGDKLLGGPQAGILVGSLEAIQLARKDPLMRALRVDKMTLAALEATLHLALDPTLAGSRIPLWSFLNASRESLLDRAGSLAETFRSEFGLDATVIESTAFLGGGSAPLEPLPTAVVRVGPPFRAGLKSEGDWARMLRLGDPAIVTRVQGGAVLFDLRAVAEGDDPSIVEAVRRSMRGEEAERKREELNRQDAKSAKRGKRGEEEEK